MTVETRSNRKVLEGWVVSDKMDKTRVVEVRWSKRDPQYEKIRNLTTKVYAHDEKNESHSGDRVRVAETRPMSSKKRWRITDILNKATVKLQ
ncbi:MAG: 30S ribosomal protein S17 [Elusimicrobia bacterium]|nr:30S ribosomal protein S17 [Elusimicrobiota bacterium]